MSVRKFSMALGVDVGGTRTKVGLVSLAEGRVLAMEVFPTVTRDGVKFLSRLQTCVRPLLRRANALSGKVLGLGIGVPGYVREGVVDTTWGFLPFMEDYPLLALLSKKTGLPCRVDNDARLVGLGEAVYGAGKGSHRCLTVTLGTGVGLGLIVDGKFPDEDPCGHMGGHMRIREKGPACYCGQAGCFEALVSSSALVKSSRGMATPESVFQAALRGDRSAVQAVNGFLEALAVGLNNFTLLWAPDVLVLAGGLSNALGPYLPRLRSSLKAKVHKSYRVEIELSSLREAAGILGAARLAGMSLKRVGKQATEG